MCESDKANIDMKLVDTNCKIELRLFHPRIKVRNLSELFSCLLSSSINIVGGGGVGHLKDLLNFSKFTLVTLRKKVNLLITSLWYWNLQNNVVKVSSVFGDLFSVKTGEMQFIGFDLNFHLTVIYYTWKCLEKLTKQQSTDWNIERHYG